MSSGLTSALASITASYTDSEEEDIDDDPESPPADAEGRVGEAIEVEAIANDSEDPIEEATEVEPIVGVKVKIPPEPPGKPSIELQERVNMLYEKKMRTGLDMNVYIQKNKQFRNPSIYEKLIKHCNIDELGTNYPSNIYDPHEWTESSFYDELGKTQKADMDRREKEKKERDAKKERGRVEFVTGTVKNPAHPGHHNVQIRPTISVGSVGGLAAIIEQNKRKSKWDQRGSLNMPMQ